MSKVLEARLDLITLINQETELSGICKGQCAIPIHSEKKHYCTLAKGFNNIKCYNLYKFSNFPNACLYEPKHDKGRGYN